MTLPVDCALQWVAVGLGTVIVLGIPILVGLLIRSGHKKVNVCGRIIHPVVMFNILVVCIIVSQIAPTYSPVYVQQTAAIKENTVQQYAVKEHPTMTKAEKACVHTRCCASVVVLMLCCHYVM